MVGNLQDAGLVVDEKLDMIIEHLRKQEEHTARLELRLAEYSESIAEVRNETAPIGGTLCTQTPIGGTKTHRLVDLLPECAIKWLKYKEQGPFPTRRHLPDAVLVHGEWGGVGEFVMIEDARR